MALKISRILHAGYIFECGSQRIAFDPIFENPFSRNCYAFPNVHFDQKQIQNLRLDAVFISHFHDDHCSLESLDLLDRATPIYIYCIYEELFSWIRELGFTSVHSLPLDIPIQIGTFVVTPRRALDEDVDSIFHIHADGLNVLNVVDSWIPPSTLHQLSQQTHWDMILWPFQTMREIEVLSPFRAQPPSGHLPEEWTAQLQKLNPRYVVPSSCQFIHESWSWYNHALFPISYRQFQEQLDLILPRSSVVRLEPSASIVLDQGVLATSAPLPWIQRVDQELVDYQYQQSQKTPSSAEVARRFPALNAAQAEKVETYCQSGLVRKYNSMDPPLDEYFEKPRLWQLSVFDHRGQAKIFRYRIKGGSLQPAPESEEPLAWSTEVAGFKLLSALETGESLTSMYMRINDQRFDSNIEQEIANADIVEDPLVRCLFTGAFGAYQREQLARLQKRALK